MSGLLGNPAGLPSWCHAFSGDVAAAEAAPAAPAATIEREWQQTLATMSRVATACQSGRYTQMSADLQPASLTIHDLTAQVTSQINGA
jgi:hypothetical protein